MPVRTASNKLLSKLCPDSSIASNMSCGRTKATSYTVLCLYRNLNVFLWKWTKTVATGAAPFGSDMHQIVCWLGLCPRPHSGSLQRSPTPPSFFRGGTYGVREGARGREKEGGEGRKGSGRGKERGGSPGMPKSRVGKPMQWCQQAMVI